MPIFLLPELVATLQRTARVLAPWSRLVDLEEQLLRRARGAFLVHWFGTSIPVKGINLHIAIANIDDLKRRYLEVKEAMQRDPEPELNLLGPLAGLAGLLVGIALSPTGVMLIASQARRIMDALTDEPWSTILTMLYRLVGVWLLPILGPAAVGLLVVPFLLAQGVGYALGGDPKARGVYLALGEAAMLIDAVVRFWDQLMGPRSEIRNPLLRKILDVLDLFAGLYVQFIGLVSLFVTRIARLLPYVMDQFRALADLLESVMDAVSEIFDGIMLRIALPFILPPTPLTIIDRVFESFIELPGILIAKVSALVEESVALLMSTFGEVSTKIDAFVVGLKANITAAFEATVVGMMLARIKTLLKLMPDIKEAFKKAAEEKKKEAKEEKDEGKSWARRWLGDPALWILTGGFTGSLDDLFESFKTFKVPDMPKLSIPDFPAVPTLPDLAEIKKRIGEPPTFDAVLTDRLKEEAKDAVSKRDVADSALKDPISVFARERRKLEKDVGRPKLQLNDQNLRDLIYAAVGRVLPPALRVYAPDVRAFFDMLDKEVYGVKPAPLPEHPTLDIKDSGRLRPIVHVLTLRQDGGYAADLRAFRDLLIEQLEARKYFVQPPVPA